MRKAMILVIPATLAFAGCAKPYIQPEGADTATLTLTNESPISISVLSFAVAEDCSGGKLYFHDGAPLLPRKNLGIKVKADQAFSFSFGYHMGNKYCLMPSTFTPRRGANYVARFAADMEKCYVSVVAVTDTGEIKEPSYRLRKWRTPISESGSFCE